MEKGLESLRIRRVAGLQELAAMNGGIKVLLKAEAIPSQQLPSDFDQWYQHAEQSSPTLRRMEQAVQAGTYQEKLNRALSLPRASAGYMSENRTGEHFQGVTVGISIPLFENKNTVKYARVKTLAWQNIMADYRVQLYNQLRIQYDKAVALQKTVEDYRQSLRLYQNNSLLKKALDQGEISLLEYLMELTLTYTTTDDYLEAENELNKAIAMLYQYGE
jgi:outer membrane protein TolC